eukprot:CAMPEP_0181192450 /NCGR_PEP_ID=MMETSP1096-20121128/13292_1 /TAXON_ID=156174 ORGANISM="Chrysochromulina ericina, Strain CCMP281" /NCGR_SAMPLE_ID=MMETSP1096 /ASSEMBLY_ACC=CAM_ASM_000453 /LENGTH=327 /DNA_ID=CAMNT_0023281851 /DNA_START=128 /DNA_END=1111 /DNA_ORIENTATION=-
MTLSESPSVSSVTLAEYNRWVVETENKKAAEVRRAEMEKEKAAREQMKEDRAKAMAATMEANKGQTQKTKAVVEAKIKDKLDKGAAIRDQSHSRMQQKKAQHDAFLAKAAQQAKELGSDLKESVATKKKEQTEKNRQVFNDVKAELKAYSDAREARQLAFMTEQKLKRDEIMEGKKGIKEKDLNEEGGFGYRNKKVGEDTRAQVKVWNEQKEKAKEKHLTEVQRVKMDVATGKSGAKEALDLLKAQRKKDALEVRSYKSKVQAEFGDMSKNQGKANRDKHNELRVGKYVTAQMAKQILEDSTFTDAARYANGHKFNPETLLAQAEGE